MTEHPPSPGQTIGPFFGMALPYAGAPELVPPHRDDAIRLHGTVLDGNGDPVPDALLEIWQPDGSGAVPDQPGSLHRDGRTFTGWGRAATDPAGHFDFTTVAPGSSGGAAFLSVALFARGLLDRLFTRIYLADADGLDADALLRSLPEERRSTLVAASDGPASYRFDVHLQGERETVFLDFTESRG